VGPAQRSPRARSRRTPTLRVRRPFASWAGAVASRRAARRRGRAASTRPRPPCTASAQPCTVPHAHTADACRRRRRPSAAEMDADAQRPALLRLYEAPCAAPSLGPLQEHRVERQPQITVESAARARTALCRLLSHDQTPARTPRGPAATGPLCAPKSRAPSRSLHLASPCSRVCGAPKRWRASCTHRRTERA
jgi:hypothetical protein